MTDFIAKQGSYLTMNNVVKFVKKFQDRDMDFVLPISSMKGAGKSTLGIQLMKRHVENNLGISFSLKDYLAYDNEDVKRLINELPDKSPILCDEAARFALSEDWGKTENKDMKKLFTQIRTKHLFIIMCAPDFFWIDKKYRNEICVFWIHILKRGYCVGFTRDTTIGVDDPWHRKEFQKITRGTNIFSDSDKVIGIYRKHPCFWEEFKFPPVEARLYAQYLKYRDERIFTVNSNSEDSAEVMDNREQKRYDAFRNMIWSLRQGDKPMKYTQIVNMARDPTTGRRVLKVGFFRAAKDEVDNLIKSKLIKEDAAAKNDTGGTAVETGAVNNKDEGIKSDCEDTV